MGKRLINDRLALLMFGMILVTAGYGIFVGAVHAAEGVRNASAPDLDRFMPEGIDRFYHREDCKLTTVGPCALWVAGEQDARYMIFSPREGSTRETIGAAPLVRSVLPDDLTLINLSLTPKFDSSDPETWAVIGTKASGYVQIVERTDEIIVVWMPGMKAADNFTQVPVSAVATPPPQVLKEINVPNQPDVIAQDSAGYLWFSAWGNEIYRIDPATDIAQPMTGGAATGTPDGLIVDSSDSVWYGGYNERYMGTLTADSPLLRYTMPYSGSTPAIPCEAPDGKIWITDHPNNRLTEFDPMTQQWGRAITLSIRPGYPIQCLQDPSGTALWMTLWQGRSLGRLDLLTATVEAYSVPCDPAFIAFDQNGILWATCWGNGHIIQFDPVGLTGADYVIPAPSQAGGISISPDGLVVFTQNLVGRVAVLDPDRQEVYTYQLPSRPIFKDGLLVDSSGTIWAPTPNNRLVGKIVP